MGRYELRCVACHTHCEDCALSCHADTALLRAEYESRQLHLTDLPGMWKFLEWLPIEGTIEQFSGGPICYKSEALAEELGLDDLFIAFNGYWPEKSASLATCSFKDLEASPTVRRLIELGGQETLVVASAGNTARAFANVASFTHYPLVLVVPSMSMHRLWLSEPVLRTSSIFVIAVEGDYSDAIALGEKLSSLPGFIPEGGARNVARRDGMGTVMLESTLQIGSLPDHYFQAIGSGTGGISAWEASMRLIGDGRFGDALPKLHLAQNLPCAPIYSAANNTNYDPRCPEGMYDDVLFNRKPPFSVPGGVRDALTATKGDVVGITNVEAEDARLLFERTEGIDIMPAAAVAVAALVRSISEGKLPSGEKVLLNITGGGVERLRKDRTLTQLRSDLVVKKDDQDIAFISRQALQRSKEIFT